MWARVWTLAAFLGSFAALVLPEGGARAAAPSAFAGRAVEQSLHRDVVEVAKKRKRIQRVHAKTTEESIEAPLQAAPGDTLIESDIATVLLKPLTPAPSYRAGQSVFFEITVAKRKGVRARQTRIELSGAEATVTEQKGVTTKHSDTITTIDVPLGSRQKLMVEIKVAPAATPATPESQVAIRLREKKDGPILADGALVFAVGDCATSYHRALGGLYVSHEASYTDLLKRAAQVDETLPGAWLFPPRKRSTREIATGQATQILLPPRAECRWSVSTIDFSTRESKRFCKRWEIVEIGGPASVNPMPVIDEEAAARILRRASGFVTSRGAANDFGKNGKLEWISRRILTDIRGYMQQPPHPAICTGAEVMTSYFVDNAVTLRKELTASAESVEAARRIAAMRLEVLAIKLGKPPEDPVATASLSLVTPAHAATVETATALDQLSKAGRLLLGDEQRLRLEAAKGLTEKLRLLHDALAEPVSPTYPEAARPAISDALTALEAVVYLEAADARYAGVGDAIFGSISDIGKAHDASCGCAP